MFGYFSLLIMMMSGEMRTRFRDGASYYILIKYYNKQTTDVLEITCSDELFSINKLTAIIILCFITHC